MLQVYESLFETAFRFSSQYGRPVTLAVFVLVGCSVAWGVLSRVLGWSGPKDR
jgi:hypothetical protein